MKELSVFIDESGDFGEITERPAYYLVTLLLHDQKTFFKAIDKKDQGNNILLFFPYSFLTREKRRIHRCQWAGKLVNTGKLEKYTT